jgi:hypothetical protein
VLNARARTRRLCILNARRAMLRKMVYGKPAVLTFNTFGFLKDMTVMEVQRALPSHHGGRGSDFLPPSS